jgi:signal transduction histidine kinase
MSMPAGSLLPPDEAERLAAVRRYDVLDTPPDGAFDRITALAARFHGVPISTVTIVDEDRIWFKSTYGVDVEEIGRDPGLCASAILHDEPYVVTDASLDPRTLDNPLVRGELGLRHYVGIPLRTADGHNLGTLNVIGIEPREVSAEEMATLQDLAAIVMDELELRLSATRTVELHAQREAAALRDAIIMGISHEMRTPLAVLQSLSRLEDVSAPGAHDEAERRGMLGRQVRHLDWLLSQFLDFARLEDDRSLRVVPEPLELAEVVDDACDVFADRATVTVEYRTTPPPVTADRDRTRQVLIELINNAVRFGGPESPVHVVVTRAGDEARVEVVDRGPGLDPSDRERIFERYYRHPTSTGSGVGLYVARWCAEAQGGRIEVDSRSGDGSRFTLVLPAAPQGPRTDH